MCQKESWEAIVAPKEAHSTQRGQPPRMHGPGLWRYEQKEQRVTPVPMIGGSCDLWCPGWDSKDLGGCKPHSVLQTLLYNTYKVIYIHKNEQSEYNMRVRKVLRILSSASGETLSCTDSFFGGRR